MEACHEAINDGEGLVHQWRVTQLTRPGIAGSLAQAEADHVDWHQTARLVQRGCAPALAVRVAR
jgi:hypothetical protein